MKPKWLFFDLGSTLVDETIAYRYRVLEAIEGSTVSYEQFDSKRIEYAKTLSAGDKEAAKFYNLTLKPWRNDKEKLYDGVNDILSELSRRGYRLAVLANQAKGTCDRLANWGILHFFDIVLAYMHFFPVLFLVTVDEQVTLRISALLGIYIRFLII